jgi:aminoglycoside 2'-N-acetyltransferase I
MVTVELVHTAHVPSRALVTARALLDDAFDGDFDDADWTKDPDAPHASQARRGTLHRGRAVVQRRVLHGGRALRTGYVEAVAVAAAHRRRGVASAVVAGLEEVVRGAYDLGALGATDDGAALYAARGWQRWRGPTSVLGPAGTVRTPDDDGSVLVLPGAVPLDLEGSLTCDWRDGDVW